MELGDLVHRVDQIQAFDTVRVALMHRVDSQIAGLALRCRFAPLTDLEADRPGLVDAAALGPVLAQVVRWPLEIVASRSQRALPNTCNIRSLGLRVASPERAPWIASTSASRAGVRRRVASREGLRRRLAAVFGGSGADERNERVACDECADLRQGLKSNGLECHDHIYMIPTSPPSGSYIVEESYDLRLVAEVRKMKNYKSPLKAWSYVMKFDLKRMLQPELNIGLSERKTRFGVGIASLLVSVFLANIPLLMIGMILVTTAKVRWCPIYSGLGRSTTKPGEESIQHSPQGEQH